MGVLLVVLTNLECNNIMGGLIMGIRGVMGRKLGLCQAAVIMGIMVMGMVMGIR